MDVDTSRIEDQYFAEQISTLEPDKIDDFLKKKAVSENDLNEALLAVSLEGQAPIISVLIHNGAQVDALDRALWTPLMRASALGKNPEAIEILLSKGAKINAQNDYGRTALIEAACSGDVPVLNVLLQHGADPDIVPDIVGGPALVEAAQAGRADAVILLAQQSADVNQTGKREKTALHYMAEKGYADAVDALIRAGALIDARSYYGTTPLFDAARNGHLNVVRMLIDAGADIRVQDKNGNTLLLAAAGHYRDSSDLIAYLLKKGGNPKAVNNDGRDAYQLASQARNPQVLSVLDKFFTKIRHTYSTEKRSEALLSAVMTRDLPTVSHILEQGRADVNHEGRYTGWTPLMMAAAWNQTEIMNLLIRNRADIHLRDKNGNTAFLHAAENFHIPMMEKLMDLGADIACTNKNGQTALLVATTSLKKDYQQKTVPTLQYCIEHGLDINVKDNQGTNPLMAAVETVKIDAIQFLIQSGAHVNDRNLAGETPLIFAARRGHMDERFFPVLTKKQDFMLIIIDLLLNAGADPSISTDRHHPLVDAVRYRTLKVVQRLIAEKQYSSDTLNRSLLACTREAPSIARLLISKGADIHTRGYQGRTSLMAVAGCWRDAPKTMDALIKKGADVNAVDENGQTALMHAARTHSTENVQYLLKIGANPSIRDKTGRNAIDHALDMSNDKHARMIENYSKYR